MCLYLALCVYVSLYVYMSVCTYVYIYVHMYGCVYGYIYINIYIYIYVCMNVFMYICVCIGVWIHIFICVCITGLSLLCEGSWEMRHETRILDVTVIFIGESLTHLGKRMMINSNTKNPEDLYTDAGITKN